MPDAVNDFVFDVNDKTTFRFQRVEKRLVKCQKLIFESVRMDAVVVIATGIGIRRRSYDQIYFALVLTKFNPAIATNYPAIRRVTA